jgi:hypothetical protein
MMASVGRQIFSHGGKPEVRGRIGFHGEFSLLKRQAKIRCRFET